MKNFYQDLPKPFFVLAPMDDVTDTAFRRIVRDCAAPDVYFTEFASADGLQSKGRSAVEKKLLFTEGEKPLVAQIWGKNPQNYKLTASELVERGFEGVDINFGCPVPKVIKNGCCSALINNRDLAHELIEATKEGLDGRIPLSLKCRIGFNSIDLTWIEFLLSHKPAVLSVHGRTTKEMSKVPMHWEVFDEIVAIRDRVAPDTLIVANGDILSRAEGLERAKQHNLDGIMIGRGVFKDPFVFSADSPWADYSKKQRLELFRRHIDLFEEAFPDSYSAVLRKFAKVYVNGFDGASELRSRIMEQENFDDLRTVLSTS